MKVMFVWVVALSLAPYKKLGEITREIFIALRANIRKAYRGAALMFVLNAQ